MQLSSKIWCRSVSMSAELWHARLPPQWPCRVWLHGASLGREPRATGIVPAFAGAGRGRMGQSGGMSRFVIKPENFSQYSLFLFTWATPLCEGAPKHMNGGGRETIFSFGGM